MDAEKAQLAVLNQKLSTQRYQLADHFALMVLEALEIWVQLASQLANPSRPAAKQQLERYVRVLESARALAAGITVIGALPEEPNGRA